MKINELFILRIVFNLYFGHHYHTWERSIAGMEHDA